MKFAKKMIKILCLITILSSILYFFHFKLHNDNEKYSRYIEEIKLAQTYVFSTINGYESKLTKIISELNKKSIDYVNISNKRITLYNDSLVIDHSALYNVTIIATTPNSKVIIGARNTLINITFIGLPEIVIKGESNVILGMRVIGLNRTRSLTIYGSNNLLYDVYIADVGIGIKFINSHNNVLWKFNISRVGMTPVVESPKLISILQGNNNVIAHGYGLGPYPNWGIYIERGMNNIIFNVTITSAHNYFKFANVESLYIVQCKALRKAGFYGDDYVEGSIMDNGKLFIINTTFIGSGTDALHFSGKNATVYVVNPIFFLNQNLVLITEPWNNLTIIFVNGSLSLVETETWYLSYIPQGVKLILINTTITLLELLRFSGIIETYPLPLPLTLIYGTVKAFWKLLLILFVIIFGLPLLLRYFIVYTIRKSSQ